MKPDNRTLFVLLLPLPACAALALTSLTAVWKGAAAPIERPPFALDLDASAQVFPPLRVGALAPAPPLLDREGHEYRLPRYRGHRVLLAFFHDSPRCIRLAPRWEKIHRQAPDVIVLGISTHGPADLPRFRQATRV